MVIGKLPRPRAWWHSCTKWEIGVVKCRGQAGKMKRIERKGINLEIPNLNIEVCGFVYKYKAVYHLSRRVTLRTD
jgi:hypothetical protein